ncbi:methionyl-tRNA formyltransferase [Halomarina pelagica]|uniref:methionyl-tRNA formyltransferase n=1 Tax=Halomarina pelagica TaxID=2961599 RepID=UPI0020C201EB|nr:methionyl-tRNA formyltransferase [Halomarina sp. BND7]
MRVVFLTNDEVGLACLDELIDLGADVRGVFTRPSADAAVDLPSFADRHDVPLYEVSVDAPEPRSRIDGCDPELLFAVGWSRLVDETILELASVAALGVHPAPLPRGRGHDPVAWSLIKGLEETALSLFHLAEDPTAGDLVGQRSIEIEPTDDAAALREKVVEAARASIRAHYPAFERGEVPRTPQDEDEATWWPKRDPRHGLVDWTRSPGEVHDWIRGLSRPHAGAFSYLHGRRVTLWAADPPSDERVFCAPGELLYRDGGALGVGAWEGVVELARVQVDGEDERPAATLLDREGVSFGDRFEAARDRLP